MTSPRRARNNDNAAANARRIAFDPPPCHPRLICVVSGQTVHEVTVRIPPPSAIANSKEWPRSHRHGHSRVSRGQQGPDDSAEATKTARRGTCLFMGSDKIKPILWCCVCILGRGGEHTPYLQDMNVCTPRGCQKRSHLLVHLQTIYAGTHNITYCVENELNSRSMYSSSIISGSQVVCKLRP